MSSLTKNKKDTKLFKKIKESTVENHRKPLEILDYPLSFATGTFSGAPPNRSAPQAPRTSLSRITADKLKCFVSCSWEIAGRFSLGEQRFGLKRPKERRGLGRSGLLFRFFFGFLGGARCSFFWGKKGGWVWRFEELWEAFKYLKASKRPQVFGISPGGVFGKYPPTGGFWWFWGI